MATLRLTLLRVLVSAAAAAAVMLIACAALFVTHAARPVSLLVEPFSLLLLPGLCVSLLFAGARDYSAVVAVRAAAAFYLIVFFLLSLRWPRTHRRSL